MIPEDDVPVSFVPASAEVRLDGHDASLLLKADAATVNALSATVTDARIDIDALQGGVRDHLMTFAKYPGKNAFAR